MPVFLARFRRSAPRRALVAIGSAFVALVLSASPARAQSGATGRVVGRVIDAATGQALTDVAIQVVGTTLGTQSTVDGRYVIRNVPAGTVTLHVRRIGFAPKTITGLMLATGGALKQDIALTSAAISLEAQVVSASAERGTVNEALDQQRSSTRIVNAVTAEQISRSPDADAAQAVRRVSGVTVQGGRYVEVRGLGERYVTASLNGARLPSPEPERRVVPLDLFPSALLQSVTTTKTFTPDMPGDFSGAQVDVTLREFPLRRATTFSASVGYNGAVTGRDVLHAPMTGAQWFGFSGARRDLPGALSAAGNLDSPLLTQADVNGFVRSFRNVWTPETSSGAANVSSALSTGGETAILGQRLGYIASASYATRQEVRADEIRGRAVVNGSGDTEPYNQYVGSTGRQSVTWGGLANFSALFGGGSRIELNNAYTRIADNDAHEDFGTFEELDLPVHRMTLDYVERSVRSNQLRGEHLINGDQTLKWSITSSGVSRAEPDRSDIVYGQDLDPATGERLPYAWVSYRPDFTKRTFAALSENGLTTDAHYSVRLGPAGHETVLKGGAYFRHTTRSSDTRAYDLIGRLGNTARRGMAEDLVVQYSNPSDQVFSLQSNSNGGSYDASDRVTAGFGMVDYPVGSRIHLVAGARVERSDLTVKTQVIGSTELATATLDNTDVLPSLLVNVALTDAQNLRLAATQTLSRPEYRELSPFGFRDLIEEINIRGNPELKRALVRNYDVRWEWYPDAGELLSLGAFYKDFTNPIEQIELATTGVNERSFINTEGAYNYGVELEVRKELGAFAAALAPWSVFTNATFMQSRINTGENNGGALTNATRQMVGQAPYVVNAGLSYRGFDDALSATLLYNTLGRRIVSAGVQPLPDVYEQPRNAIDLSLRYALHSGMSLRLDAKNLTDEAYVVKQGDVLRSAYTSGRSFTVGVSWRQ